MTANMTYEKLYSNMVKKFTVEKDNKDYKLGEYMLMKADSAKPATAASKLPVAVSDFSAGKAITAAFTYISEKLTVKEAPVRDRTMRKFPFRTSLTALCSAVVICALVISYGIIGLKNLGSDADAHGIVYSETEQEVDDDNYVTYSFPGEK